MKYDYIDKEIMIDGLYTELGKKIATKFDPKTLIKVVAERRGVEGDPTEHVVFYFEDGTKICIFNSFTTGINDKIKVTKKGKIKITKIGYFFDTKIII